MFVRKRPVVVEAFLASDLIHAASKDWRALPKCVAEAYEKGNKAYKHFYRGDRMRWVEYKKKWNILSREMGIRVWEFPRHPFEHQPCN